MSSTGAGTPPAAGDGAPPAPEAGGRSFRDRPLGRILILVAVLAVAFVAARSCAATNRDVSADEAIEIAIEEASFEPCEEPRCRSARFVQRGIPVRGYWGVVLAKDLDENGQPTRTESFLVSAATGEVSPP